jgi:antitoxin HicB
MLQYPAILEKDTNGTVRVEFPDVPEAHTFGEDEAEALLQAVDALETALGLYIDDRRNLPKPSPVRKRMKAVLLPALTEMKIELYLAMRKGGVGKAELARRLNCHLPQIDRLLDLTHSSRMERLEEAFHALDKRLSVRVVKVA